MDLFSVFEFVVYIRGQGYKKVRGFYEEKDAYYLALPVDAEEVEVLYVDWSL